MKIFCLPLLLHFTLPTFISSSPITLSRDEDGYLGIRATHASGSSLSDNSEIFVMLMFADDDWIDTDTRSSLLNSNFSNITLLLLDTWEELMIPMSMLIGSRRNDLSEDWVFGVNPGSFLVTHFGPLTIALHNTNYWEAIMFVNSSLSFFQSLCVSQSIIHFPLRTARTSSSTNHVSTNVSFSTIGPNSGIYISPQITLIISKLETFNVLAVPSSLRNIINARMIQLGAVEEFSGSPIFLTCSESLIEELPPIVLYLGQSGNDRIVIYSSDYITFSDEMDYCFLGLSVIDNDTNFASIDFFKLESFNLHISSSRISVCDSAL